MSKRILIVDDEPSIRKVLAAHLTRFGFSVSTAKDGREAIERIESELFHLVVTDLRMPRLDGMGLLSHVLSVQPGLPVIIITAHGTVDTAVHALKSGAFDYITKPFDQDVLRTVIEKALTTEERGQQNLVEGPGAQKAIVGTGQAVRSLHQLIGRVASSPTTILILGESGTGKELVARAIHEQSGRAERPFIQINCGAIPDGLFESELFGYERGAFTGAAQQKMGRFELADGGTLFLDEVAELPKEMQVKLLRALQERQIDRVGGLRPIAVDVRVLAATNVDLASEVQAHRFREDLYYRLNVVPIQLPALRDRIEDIADLVEHFLKKFNTRLDRSVQSVSSEALLAFSAYPWPGNIRELENLMERLVLLCPGDRIEFDQLPALFQPVDALLSPGKKLDEMGLKEYVRVHTVKLERRRIQKALSEEAGNVTRTARRLGISRKSLQTKMKDYKLREES